VELWNDAQMRAMDKMLNPKSIAVVGASPKGGYGGACWDAVLKGEGPRAPLSRESELPRDLGHHAYRSVSDLPEAPDLVGVVVPYKQVIPVLREMPREEAGFGGDHLRRIRGTRATTPGSTCSGSSRPW
jgi:acyl-CoA synthetase (NDP forming)